MNNFQKTGGFVALMLLIACAGPKRKSAAKLFYFYQYVRLWSVKSAGRFYDSEIVRLRDLFKTKVKKRSDMSKGGIEPMLKQHIFLILLGAYL